MSALLLGDVLFPLQFSTHKASPSLDRNLFYRSKSLSVVLYTHQPEDLRASLSTIIVGEGSNLKFVTALRGVVRVRDQRAPIDTV